MCSSDQQRRPFKNSDLPQRTLENISDGILIIDGDLNIIYRNRMAKYLILKEDENGLMNSISPDMKDLLRTRIENSLDTGQPFMDRFRTSSSNQNWIEITGSRIPGDGGPLEALQIRDVTDSVIEENILCSSQAMIYTLMSNLPGMAFRSKPDHDRTMDFISEGCMELTGYSPDQLTMEVPFGSLINRDDLKEVNIAVREAVEKGSEYECVYRLITKEGSIKWIWEKGVGFPSSDDNPSRVEGFMSDMTERKLMEEKLNEYREHLEKLVLKRTEDLANEKKTLSATLSSIGDGVITTDIKGNVTMMNRIAEELTGTDTEEAKGRDILSLICGNDPEKREKLKEYFRKVIENDETVDNHISMIITGGKERIVEINSSRMAGDGEDIKGIVLAIRDVTTRKKMEEEASRNQRLESIGVLAGGIAHDFNNMLTSMLANIAIAKSALKPGKEEAKALTDAEEAAYSARDLTSQLLTFSRGGEPVKKRTNPESILRECAKFSFSGSVISVEFMIDEDIWEAEIDQAQFKQAINNILINAKEAMPGGGKVIIRIENTRLKKGYGPPLKEGNYLKISIKDNGIGMPRSVTGKVFDPYFSTKSEGRGMGLATTFSIIREHYGHVDVVSNIEEGSKFIIYIPAILSPGEAMTTSSMDEVGLSGHERILLMDDDKLLLGAISKLLSNQGYVVDSAKDGKEAVEMYHRQLEKGERYDSIILDVTVPGGMGGKEAMNRIMDFDPAVKAIVSSGYSNDPIMSNYRDHGFKGVLKKPYRIEELKSILLNVIHDL